MSTPSDSPNPDIDVWTTPLGRWRLATVEWLRRRRESPEALCVDGRPSEGPLEGPLPTPYGNLSIQSKFGAFDPPSPDEPCPDEIDGNVATAGVTIPTDTTETTASSTETLQ